MTDGVETGEGGVLGTTELREPITSIRTLVEAESDGSHVRAQTPPSPPPVSPIPPPIQFPLAG